MKNLKISSKLVVSFLVVIAMAIIVGVIGIFGMFTIDNADTALYDENVLAVTSLGYIRMNLGDQRLISRNMVLNGGNSEAVKTQQNNLTAKEKEMDALLAKYERTIINLSQESKVGYAHNPKKEKHCRQFMVR